MDLAGLGIRYYKRNIRFQSTSGFTSGVETSEVKPEVL
jgi:hypothetical protein